MPSISKKYVFVDLDETLISSVFVGINCETPLAENEILLSNGERYYARLRPGAHELLANLRQLVGQNIYMLTSSIEEYAAAFDAKFDLGFGSNIYARAQIQSGELNPAFFPYASGVYLIDNLPRHDNHMKIRFLRPINPDVTYIRISEYHGAHHYEGDSLDLGAITPEESQAILDIIRR